ncbi:FAD-dependent oxidoreductase [Massilia sp. W12]|uniref:FAD-binding oxidoreductase n=1 Tax=Massilia sp. W12 TaxID=3126507 RepID=UPI0030CBCD21
MDTSSTATRRRFLQTGAVLGAAGAAGAIGVLPEAQAKTPAKAPAFHRGLGNLDALRKTLHGRLILPGEMGYMMAAYPNNARWADVLPFAIVMCADAHDVQFAIRWARDLQLPFAIRSGGHNYAGFSTTRGLLIDVKAMNGIRLDPKNGTVTIAAGVNNQNMADAMSGTDFAVPSGRCPTVGAAGLVLGGGWGFAATHAGLTCDSLVASEIVLASGKLVTATPENEYKDLFWGLCGGGGGNFGVNTSFTFQLHDVRDDVTIFNLLWPGEKQVEMLLLLQKIQLDNATTISTRTKAYPERAGAHPKMGELQVATLGQFFGPKEKLMEILRPALELVKPIKMDIRQMRYWQARDYLITDDPTGMYDIRSSYVESSLGGEALENMLKWMTKWPGGSLLPENMGILFAIGGKVKARAPDATAYVHRNANFIFEMECAWAPIDKGDVVRRQQAWLSDYYNDMQRFVLKQSYVNFPCRDIPHAIEKYYAGNLKRLKEIKRKYDPLNTFRFEQSIPL